MTSCFGIQGPELRAGPYRIAETHHAQGMVLPRHAHGEHCLHLVLGGVYQETSRGSGRSLGPATLLFKPAGVVHSNDFRQAGARTLRVEFASRHASHASLRPGHFVDPAFRTLGRRLLAEYRRPDDWSHLSAEGLCHELLALLGRRDDSRRRGADRDLAQKARRVLRDRFDQSVRMGELALRLGTHRSHLARTFRAVHGCTMGEYLRGLRVQAAVEALHGDRSLADIAIAVGFADQSHLTRVFRRAIGLTPAAYRRRLRGKS